MVFCKSPGMIAAIRMILSIGRFAELIVVRGGAMTNGNAAQNLFLSRTESMGIRGLPARQGGRRRRAPLELELSQILARVKSPRDRALVARHLGWDGDNPCSLKQAGAGFHLTRERARQVYAEALPLLRLSAETSSLDAVLRFIGNRSDQLVSEV